MLRCNLSDARRACCGTSVRLTGFLAQQPVLLRRALAAPAREVEAARVRVLALLLPHMRVALTFRDALTGEALLELPQVRVA